jgi:hypothetical protein
MLHFALEYLQLQVHLQDPKNVSVRETTDQQSSPVTFIIHFHGDKLNQLKADDNKVKYNGDNQQVRLDCMNV